MLHPTCHSLQKDPFHSGSREVVALGKCWEKKEFQSSGSVGLMHSTKL